MKRDILDDYREFLMATRDQLKFEMHPKRATVDDDGDIKQEMYIRVHIPGGGIAYGAGVVWYPQRFFPHGEYDEPCENELLFAEIPLKHDNREQAIGLDTAPDDDLDDLTWLDGYDL